MIQRKNLLERKMKNGFGKSVSTYPVELNNIIENPIRDLKVYGNSEQETSTEGRNMCPTDFSEWESGHYSNTTGEKQPYSGRVRANRLIKVKPSTAYYYDMFWKKPEDETTELVVLIRKYDVNKNFLGIVSTYLNKGVHTTSSDEYYVSLSLGQAGSEFTWTYETFQTFFKNGNIKPLWCLNSETDKTFVEYVPNSPSPEYPSEIESCGDEGYVEVTARRRNICLTDFNNWEPGHYSTLGNKDGHVSRCRLINLLRVTPNETFYARCYKLGDTSYKFALRAFDKNGNFLRDIGIVGNGNTFSTKSEEYYIAVSIVSIDVASAINYQPLFKNGTIQPLIQLASETNKEYEPYRGTTINFPLAEPLRRVGDYADYIDWKNRQVVRNIYSIILDGTENWKTSDAYTGYYRYNFAPSLIALKGNVNGTKGTNTHFFQRTGQNHGGYEYLYVQKNSGGGNIYIQSDKYATVEELSNYLTEQYNAGTPVKTIFVGESATYEPFTEEQNAIADLVLTPNYCNITSSNKIKPSKIEFSYKSKVR